MPGQVEVCGFKNKGVGLSLSRTVIQQDCSRRTSHTPGGGVRQRRINVALSKRPKPLMGKIKAWDSSWRAPDSYRDSPGKVHYRENYSNISNRIRVDFLPNGVYFLVLKSKKWIAYEKLIK